MNSGRVMNLRVTIPAESRRMNVGKDDVEKNAVIISLEKMKVNVSTDKEKGAC